MRARWDYNRPVMSQPREYCRPRSVEEALLLLSRKGRHRLLLSRGSRLTDASSADADSLIDLGGLPLSYIRLDDSGLRLGGLMTLQEIIDSPSAATFADQTLAEAARTTSTSLLRNQDTLAGTLLDPEANPELAVLLLVLGSEALLHTLDGSATLSLADLYRKPEACIDCAILTEVFVPAPPPGAQIHRSATALTPSDQAILTVAALTLIAEGVFREARLAAGGIRYRPRRLSDLESELAAKRAEIESVSSILNRVIPRFDFPQDRVAGSEYRRHLLKVLALRALLGGESPPA